MVLKILFVLALSNFYFKYMIEKDKTTLGNWITSELSQKSKKTKSFKTQDDLIRDSGNVFLLVVVNNFVFLFNLVLL